MRLNNKPTVQEWLGDTDIVSQHPAIGSERKDLLQQRQECYDSLMKDGLPSRKWSQWRYPELSGVLQQRFALGGDTRQLNRSELPIMDQAINIVIVDGVIDFDLSDMGALPGGVKCVPISDDIDAYERSMQSVQFAQRPFVQIAALLLQRGVSLAVSETVVLKAPIHLIHVAVQSSSSIAYHNYNVITLKSNAQVKVYEQYVCLNDADYLTNSFTHWFVGDNVELSYVKLQSESRKAYHIATVQVDQSTESICDMQCYHWGAGLSRENFTVNLNGERAQHRIKFLSAMDEKRQSHTVIQMNHRASACRSCQLVRSLADDKAQVSINGRIYVAEGATKTQADLQNKNLLLSSQAAIYTRPDLEIYNDDVVCSHGATVGSLDEQAMFYLRSKGVPYKQARELLLQAFVATLLNAVPNEALRQTIASCYRLHFYQSGELE
jgi:Fe-S cluster assembly protein SufD